MLSAIPVRNPEVKRSQMPSGRILLTGPVAATRLKRWFGTRNTEKKFEIDDLGDAVWQACDGRRTLEDIICLFAARYRVNTREAEVSVKTFLNMLTRRNLLALLIGKGPGKSAGKVTGQAAGKRSRRQGGRNSRAKK